MLVFLGAMCGVCETGNLLNLFLFFEILSIAAFLLCRYKSDPGPSRAAWTSSSPTTSPSILVLAGIALLYFRAHTMNLALLGRMLNGPADMLVAAAFAFLVCGFFVKSAIVPFHFWLPGAVSIAPLPVCVLFGGAMVQLGLYCIVRIYWTVFSGALAPHENELRTLLAAFGAITAIGGGVVCFRAARLETYARVRHRQPQRDYAARRCASLPAGARRCRALRNGSRPGHRRPVPGRRHRAAPGRHAR